MTTTLKMRRARAAYTGFAGTQTLAAVEQCLPLELTEKLTGKQLGAVMSAIHAAYNAGRASTGASIENDAVWVDPIARLIPVDALRKIDVQTEAGSELVSAHGVQSQLHAGMLYDAAGTRLTDAQAYHARLANGRDAYYQRHVSVTRYTLDYTEHC